MVTFSRYEKTGLFSFLTDFCFFENENLFAHPLLTMKNKNALYFSFNLVFQNENQIATLFLCVCCFSMPISGGKNLITKRHTPPGAWPCNALNAHTMISKFCSGFHRTQGLVHHLVDLVRILATPCCASSLWMSSKGCSCNRDMRK